MIIADTSGLLALFNRREPAHAAARAAVADASDSLVISPLVIAEVDYLVATRMGVAAELEVLAQLASGAYQLAALDAGDLRRVRTVIERYHGQSIGAADASLVVLADRHATRKLLTLDRRHFDVVRPLAGGRFTLLP